jgi:precorrin-2/cobalt-factor-2 C20-methyltransferase
MKSGILYGVGVGPGDPELMTLKAVRTIEKCDVIAVVQTGDGKNTAFEIAKQAVQNLEEKPLLFLSMEMSRNQKTQKKCRDEAAQKIMKHLDAGKNVAFLTLGDPSVYSTYWYAHKRVTQAGYPAQMIPGVPSFCAVSAVLGSGLAEGKEPMVVIPASYPDTEKLLSVPGTKILMKTGRSFSKVKQMLSSHDRLGRAQMVENCGMENQKIWRNLEDVPEEAPYFSVIISRERNG